MAASTHDARARCGAVVVAHDRLDLARACIASLRRDLPPERIVLVLNDPRTVRVDDVAAALSESAVVSPSRRRGYGANLNLGARLLPDDVEAFVFANDDVVFRPHALQRLLRVLDEHPSVAVAGGRVVDAAGTQQPSHWPFPTVRGEIRRALVTARPYWAAKRGPAAGAAAVAASQPQPQPQESVQLVPWALGAALVVRAAPFRAVGGFDERFFLYYEETDLCFRLRRNGWTTAWAPDAEVVHLGGSSIASAGGGELGRASRALYFRRRLGAARFRLLQAASVATFVVSAAYAAGGALVRPGTRPARLARVRERWAERLFL